MNTLVQPPKIDFSVSGLYNASVLSEGRDTSIIERMIRSSTPAWLLLLWSSQCRRERAEALASSFHFLNTVQLLVVIQLHLAFPRPFAELVCV